MNSHGLRNTFDYQYTTFKNL